jgi:DNA-3-methyladenine glycosylase
VIDRAARDGRIVERGWFDRPAPALARALLGCRLSVAAAEGVVAGTIVETEAYVGPEDLAAHSARGRTARNATMFGPPGRLYVYLIYGLHHCINVVAGPGEKAAAVLIRAVAIDEGIDLARARRGPGVPDVRLASGPGNVARALGIDRTFDGTDLVAGSVAVHARTRRPRILTGPRVGVDYAGRWAARPLRFWIADDRHVSRAR